MRTAKGRWNSLNRRWWLERSQACPCDWHWRVGHGAAGRNAARTWLPRDGLGFGGLSARVDAAGKFGDFVLPHLRCGAFTAYSGRRGDWKRYCPRESGSGRGAGPKDSLPLAAGDAGRSVSARQILDCGEWHARQDNDYRNAGVDFPRGREAAGFLGWRSCRKFWEELRAGWRRGIHPGRG